MNIGRRKTARADRLLPPPPPTPEQAAAARRIAHVRTRMAQRLAEMDAEIVDILAAARVESEMWISGKIESWKAARERRAGYAAAMADALDAMRGGGER